MEHCIFSVFFFFTFDRELQKCSKQTEICVLWGLVLRKKTCWWTGRPVGSVRVYTLIREESCHPTTQRPSSLRTNLIAYFMAKVSFCFSGYIVHNGPPPLFFFLDTTILGIILMHIQCKTRHFDKNSPKKHIHYTIKICINCFIQLSSFLYLYLTVFCFVFIYFVEVDIL